MKRHCSEEYGEADKRCRQSEMLFLCSRDPGPPPSTVSEAEFEEIMKRNRAISSSAISKAVSGASAGNPAIPLLSSPSLWFPRVLSFPLAGGSIT